MAYILPKCVCKRFREVRWQKKESVILEYTISP